MGTISAARRVAILAVLVLAAVLMAASLARSQNKPGPGHAPKSFFGVVTTRDMAARDAILMHRNGVDMAHFGLVWPNVEPNPSSARDWNRYDKVIGRLAAHGIRSMPDFWGTPHWVSDSFNDYPLASAAGSQGWEDFLRAAVDRYGPGGAYWTQPNLYASQFPGHRPMPIRTWQIWNEPTLRKFFPRENYVSHYARMLQVSHRVITASDPDAQIVLAGVPGTTGQGSLPSPSSFLRALYKVPGIKQTFDATALHPYASTIKQFRSSIQKVRAAMRRAHDAHSGLWLTEMGWGSGHPNRYGKNKGLKGQQRLLKRSFKTLLSNRKRWKIQGLFWFTWRDPSSNVHHDCSFCGSAGLLRHNFKPKPALKTFRGFAK